MSASIKETCGKGVPGIVKYLGLPPTAEPRINEIIQDLPKSLKEVAEMRFLKLLSTAEIARARHTTKAVSQNQIHLVINRFKQAFDLAPPPKEIKTKKCSGKCKKRKPVTEFYKCRDAHDGLSPACKTCLSKQRKSWYQRQTPEVLRADRARYRAIDPLAHKVRQLFYSSRERAKLKGWEFNLTKQFLKKLIEQTPTCSISGRKLDPSAIGENSISLDRIDSNKGYTKENVRLIVWILNRAMNHDGDAVFLRLCQDVVAHHNRHQEVLVSSGQDWSGH